MDYLIVLLLGVLIGAMVAWFWFSISNRWKSSQNLRSSYDKTVKEIAEKNKKAKEDRRKARSNAVRAFFEFLILVVAIFLILAVAFNLFSSG